MTQTVLLVEDDAHLREGLCELLRREGLEPHAAVSLAQAQAMADAKAFDLAILDVGLPDGDGVVLCRAWREAGRQLPVLFLTARDEEIDIVRGLDAGGDDYVVKPFRMQELLSRVRALLRRNTVQLETVGELSLDIPRQSVRLRGEQLYLTPTEFRLLVQLWHSRGRIQTRELLLQSIWDVGGQFIDDNTLSVHISRLRDKIGAQHIKTIRGIGYQWLD
ncbi:MAG: response regulator transcription factor [Clostridiales bacterium]|nr:response regulator transcription factor [Clostridiales bacterium]